MIRVAAVAPRALAAVLLVAGALIGGASCASVIGVDDYRDAVADMCKCNEQLSFLGSVQDCQTTISLRLDGASEETRAKWLEEFAEQDCSTCNRALRCFYTQPTCSTGSCGSSEECCGAGDGGGYCYKGTCYREPKDCIHTGEACNTVEDCCGSEANLATCGDQFGMGRVCLESCGDGAPNCPNCCTILEYPQDGSIEQHAVCADERDEQACAAICDPTHPEDFCPVQGQSCLPMCGGIAENVCVYICQ